MKAYQNIESVIVEQHKDLKRRRVKPEEIRFILEGHTNQQIVLILDGYDEYKPGSNQQIDDAIIKDDLPDSCIILTSRETKELPIIRDYMDAEAEITGFDEERVQEYVTKFLGSSEKCDELMEVALKSKLINFEDEGDNQVSTENIFIDSRVDEINLSSSYSTISKVNVTEDLGEDDLRPVTCIDLAILKRIWFLLRKGERKCYKIIGKNEEEKVTYVTHDPDVIEVKKVDDEKHEAEKGGERKQKKNYGILSIPIFLHMICILFRRKVSLPKTTTGIMKIIVERCADWDEIRKTGHKKDKEMENTLIKLGEFVFNKLRQEDFQQIFDKVRGRTHFSKTNIKNISIILDHCQKDTY